MPPLLVFILAVSSALTFSFLCSVFEAVLLSVRPAQVEALAKRRSRVGNTLRRFKRDIDRPIAAILILNTLAHTVGATLAGSSYEAAIDETTLWVFSLTFTLAVLILTEIIPKTLGVVFAQQLAVPVTVAVSVLIWVLRPVLFLTSALARKLTGGRERRPVTSVEEIRLLAALGRSEGALGPRVAKFIEGVASLKELTVHDVMVAREGVSFLSATRSLEDNLHTIRASGHSRFPFTPTDNLDDVSGIVLAKELLFQVRDGRSEVDWDSLTSPLLVVPESKALDQALRMFQEQRKHLAVVVDEYGGTEGVITIEDVLEEIVGEIEDETDRVEPLVVKRPDGSLLCRGWAETRKLFRVLGMDEKVEYVTIGGFVADLLGRVPKEGDEVQYGALRFKVLKASTRRAERIEVTTIPGGDATEPKSSDLAAL